MSDLRPSHSRSSLDKGAMMRRVWPMLAVLAVAGLVIAWIDGGERALRPIVEEVELPEPGDARSAD
jgi:hypothetical protein